MKTTAVTIVLTCALASIEVNAQSFTGLGDLPGGTFRSSARAVSADGRFIVGSSSVEEGNEAFLWSEQTGMVSLGVPAGSESASANAVSADGEIVVGTHIDEEDSNPRGVFDWTSAGGILDFDPFPVGSVSPNATAISADGSVIVGFYKPTPSIEFVAYQYSGGTLTNITNGFAGATSADGMVVVGSTDQQAFRWTAAEGVTELGFLPGGTDRSSSNGISANGQVIVGESLSTNSPTFGEAFRWTSASGMEGLGDLPGGDFASSARDTTADGSIIVGSARTAAGGAPFMWDETNGMRSLVDVMTDEFGLGDAIAGWDVSSVTAISDDGTVIVGFGTNPDGNLEAWRAVLVPEPSSALLGTVVCLGRLLRRTRHEAV